MDSVATTIQLIAYTIHRAPGNDNADRRRTRLRVPAPKRIILPVGSARTHPFLPYETKKGSEPPAIGGREAVPVLHHG